MELSDAVAADVATLTAALDEPSVDLEVLLRQLSDSCTRAVESYLGLAITLVIDEVPLSLAVLEDFLDPSEIVTSVMVPLNALCEQSQEGGIVAYAGTPGAFVDLAADLSYALGSATGIVQLDRHLIPPDPPPGGSVRQISRQNQALGILLDRGRDRPEAITELSRAARLGGISLGAAAQRLIDSAVTRPRGELS